MEEPSGPAREQRRNAPRIVVTQTTAFGESEGGRMVCVEIVDQSGITAVIMIPFELEAEFFARFQGASIMAAKVRGQEPNELVANALSVEDIYMGPIHQNRIGLRLKMRNGMTMNMVLPDGAIEQFRSALKEMQDYRSSGGPSSSH